MWGGGELPPANASVGEQFNSQYGASYPEQALPGALGSAYHAYRFPEAPRAPNVGPMAAEVTVAGWETGIAHVDVPEGHQTMEGGR